MKPTHNLIGVDSTSLQWREVVSWAQRQIDAHMAQALSLSATDSERRDAAVRIDELRALIDAPSRSKRLVENHTDQPLAGY